MLLACEQAADSARHVVPRDLDSRQGSESGIAPAPLRLYPSTGFDSVIPLAKVSPDLHETIAAAVREAATLPPSATVGEAATQPPSASVGKALVPPAAVGEAATLSPHGHVGEAATLPPSASVGARGRRSNVGVDPTLISGEAPPRTARDSRAPPSTSPQSALSLAMRALRGDRKARLAAMERYRVGDVLGRGGMGEVWRVHDRHLDRGVALKRMRSDSVRPEELARFLREAQLSGSLEHPNIVPVYDLGWSPEFGFFYTMKRLTGRALVDILDRIRGGDAELEKSFGLSKALSAFVELCRAVAYSHRRGVIHSDLKPDNVIVGEYGEIVVVDWGMAQLLGPDGESQVRAQIRGGTPAYMSPEQFTDPGSNLSVEVDIWALGVILYELLTLSVPFVGADTDEIGMRVMIEPLAPPSTRAPGREIPPGIEQICMRALERDTARRYADVPEFLGDVEAWLAGTHERMRREEQIAHALDSAQALLDPLACAEADLGAALAAGADTGSLESARADLLVDYEIAAAVLYRGLRIDADATALQLLAGDLYWRIFTRLYPSHVSPGPALRERCITLLTGLFQRACSGVVQVGRQLALTVGLPAPVDPPAAGGASLWLSVAQMVAGREDQLHQGTEMHSVLARLSSLKEIPLFRGMPSANLLPIADACAEVSFPAGATIFRQGDPGDTLYVLLDGRVDILRDEAVINTLGPGECFGEIAVLGETARTASATAVDPLRTLVLDAPRFRKIVGETGEIGLAVIQALNDRLRVATRREAALRALASTILDQVELEGS